MGHVLILNKPSYHPKNIRKIILCYHALDVRVSQFHVPNSMSGLNLLIIFYSKFLRLQ